MVKKGVSHNCEVDSISKNLLYFFFVYIHIYIYFPNQEKPANQAHYSIPLIFTLLINPHSRLAAPLSHLPWDTMDTCPLTQFPTDCANGHCHQFPLVSISPPSSWDHSTLEFALLSKKALFQTNIFLLASPVTRMMHFAALVWLPPQKTRVRQGFKDKSSTMEVISGTTVEKQQGETGREGVNKGLILQEVPLWGVSGKRALYHPRQSLVERCSKVKMQRHYFVNKGLSSQSYGFSSHHVWMWELDHKEGWAPKNCCV